MPITSATLFRNAPGPLLCLSLLLNSVSAQQQPSAAQPPAGTAPNGTAAAPTGKSDKPDQTNGTDTVDAPEVDPFAVPDGTPEELVRFVAQMSAWRSQARTRAAFNEEMQKRLQAVILATGKILAQQPEEKLETFALANQFNALNVLVTQFDPSQAEQLAALATRLEQDARPELQKLPAAARLREELQAAGRQPQPETLQSLAEQIVAYVDKYGVDRDALTAASTLGRLFEASGTAEAGAKLFEVIGEAARNSADPAVAARADSLLGAARRLRLPGNVMEVRGRTADGQTFDWAAYRGQVVLVDFWASWCGPCLAELPNMKRNLERYGSKGFAIVGINMDNSTDAFEKCVADREIPWTNIVAEDDTHKGWQHPLATYYGINAIPAAILVDQQGKVVSLRARGRELDRLLESLLGPAEEPEPEKAGTATEK